MSAPTSLPITAPLRTDSYDVIVAGGGPSGAMAAIAAARQGARTLLIEQHGFLGGSLTAMGVGPMMSFHDNLRRQIIGGLPQELIDRMVKKGSSPGHVDDVITYCATVTPFDSEALKMELETMIEEAGADLLYHTLVVDAAVVDGRLTHLLVANKAGLTQLKASIFIDASGDGDVAVRAGVPFAKGREQDGLTQPMTMNLKVGNVDTDLLRRYARENPDDCEFDAGAAEGLRRLETSPRVSLKAFIGPLRRAREAGEISTPREFILLFETGTPGVFILNVSRIQGLDGTNPYDLSKAETIGRRQCAEIFRFLKKHAPGFEHAIRMDTSAQIGVRETRRIQGLYTLNQDDILNGVQFPDALCLGGYPIDIHAPSGEGTATRFFKPGTQYSIPLRCLLTEQVPNLLVGGRCLSATHEALAAIRVTPQMMALGQGTGTVAALCIRHHCDPRQLDFRLVREALVANGAMLDASPNS
jgi:hypothetical protein